ncbi:hypothetical protein [Hyalangium versicolor]|uniref:hypothetical protein n=1 Tax=Hyalangium versicolor TaxID=2861190 RepID=UPI001CCCF0C2|nr:hypothetical protein [Hyalangium versicolor]
MQTPGHAVVNLAILTSAVTPEHTLPILAGAILPDVPIVVLYLREHYLRGLPEERIWRESYQQPFWLNLIHGAHSLPLTLLGTLVGVAAGSSMVAVFFGSMLLHSLADLPLHAEDAHRHFLPFSHYRFISPISYWDVRYHARKVALVEALLVAGAAAFLWRDSSLVARLLFVAVVAWYAVTYWRAFLR